AFLKLLIVPRHNYYTEWSDIQWGTFTISFTLTPTTLSQLLLSNGYVWKLPRNLLVKFHDIMKISSNRSSAGIMDEFCGSDFWDANLTWHTNEPDLTPCFQQTVLIWAPCVFLWAFSLIEIYYIRSSRNRDIPWGFLNAAKVAVTCALVILTTVDLIKAIVIQEDAEVFAVHFYTPVIKIASFVLAGVLMFYNKKHGLQTSGLLWLFWFFLMIFAIPQCRSEVRNSNMRSTLGIEDSWAEYRYVSFMIYFTFVCEMFLLNCFADKPPRVTNYDKDEKPCPELSASFLSRMFFAWFDSLAWRGFRKPLENSDLWNMKPEDSAKEVMPLFAKYWNKTLAKTAEKNKPTPPKATFSKDSASVNFTKPKERKTASILPAIVKAFGPTFLFGAMLKLFQDILTFVSPQVLRLLINFVGTSGDENPEEDWKGIFYAVLLFVVASTQTLFLAQYFNRMFFVGLRIRTALISAIYRKALVLSNSARKESTVGEIVNLMAVDAQRFMDLTAYINMIWSAPLQIALALYFLWDILGPSVLAGLAVMIILIPVNSVIANKVKTLQIRQMKNKDERVKLMNEVLSGIKVLKLYAWEPSFEKQVLSIREREVQVLKEQAYLNAGTSFIWSCAPFLVALITFATYVLVDEANVLDASTAFVSLSLFNILRFPLSMLPMLISNMVQRFVFSVFLSTLSLYLGALSAARLMHAQLLRSVVRAPTTTFFDVTPVGRILNRFSKDVSEVDSDLPATLRAWVACFFGAINAKTFAVLSIYLGALAIILGTLRATIHMHEELLRNILRLPNEFFDTTPIGRILMRFTNDVNTMDTKLRFHLRNCLVYIFG
uniref:ABC transmembrane type-1 domain-containing protein n=2 Tax=Lutzomyia longipalpis TaxID=7200 RepID=A0A1B0CDW9_LUTLO